jgi:hypothetical protein
MLLLGIAPWLVVSYIRWREDQLWSRLDHAKSMRDQAIARWRVVYDQFSAGNSDLAAEAEARERYFGYRAQVDSSLAEIQRYYETDKELERAIEQRQARTATSGSKLGGNADQH